MVGSSSPVMIQSGERGYSIRRSYRALGLGLGHGGAAVCSDRVHDGAAGHRARWCCRHSDKMVVEGRSLSSGMVLGFMALRQRS